MIKSYLGQKEFHIEGLINELEKNDLLLLTYLSFSPENDTKSQVIEYVNSSKDFIDSFGSKTKKNVSKMNLVDMTSDFAEVFGDKDTIKSLYQILYNYEAHNEFIMYNSNGYILNGFIKIMFNGRMKQYERKLLKGADIVSKEIAIKDFKKHILFKNKPNLNILFLISTIGKLDNEYSPFKHLFAKYRDEILIMLIEEFDILKTLEYESELKNIHQQLKKVTTLESNLTKKEASLTKSREQLKIANEENKRLLKELANINKYKVDISVLNDAKAELNKQEEQWLKKLQNLIKSNEDEKARLMKKIEQEKDILRKSYKEEINELKEKLDLSLNKTIKDRLREHLEIHGIDLEMMSILEPHIRDTYTLVNNPVTEDENLEISEEIVETPSLSEYVIGYCVNDNRDYYIVLPHNERIKITNIPENIYLAENQFIKTKRDGQYIWSYNYKFAESPRDNQIGAFVSTTYKNSIPYYMVDFKDAKKLLQPPKNTRFNDNQIIAVDKDGYYIRYYLPYRNKIDEYLPSILMKEHIPYYVLNVFPNGLMLRNLTTDIETFEQIQNNDELEVEPQNVVCVKDNNLMKVFKSSKFYTLSSLYKKSEVGTVEIMNDSKFIRKVSGELVLLNDIPYKVNLNTDDIVRIDEFNNFLEVIEYKNTELSDERKKMLAIANNRTSTVRKSVKAPIELNKDVLIIGNISYENSYKMALFKNGNRAEVIDGYEPWAKVKSAIRGKDIIVVVSDFISHDNMWNVKEEVKNIPIVYPESDGANRIVDEINLLNLNN